MLTLSDAKQHLRLMEDDFDAVVFDLIEAAVQCLASIGCDVTDTDEHPAPAPLKQAARLLIGYWFDNGSIETDGHLTPTFMRLVAPYRKIEL